MESNNRIDEYLQHGLGQFLAEELAACYARIESQNRIIVNGIRERAAQTEVIANNLAHIAALDAERDDAVQQRTIYARALARTNASLQTEIGMNVTLRRTIKNLQRSEKVLKRQVEENGWLPMKRARLFSDESSSSVSETEQEEDVQTEQEEELQTEEEIM